MSSNLKTIVRGAYDIQKLRIQMGNRIVSNLKAKIGQVPGESEESMDVEGKQILADLRMRHAKLTDGAKTFPRHTTFKGDEIISSYTELCLISQYVELEKQEETHFSRLKSILRDYPVYTRYLEGVKGIGPAMAGVILSELDIYKAKYPSSIWMYCGLDVALVDGKGRSRRKEHQRDVEYVNAKGELATKKGITFNPFLKTKLVGVLGPSFLKVSHPKYADIYRNYKHRLEHHAVYKDVTKSHRHLMAIRYMVKMFLIDLYVEWRTIEGLPVARPYHEEKLGIIHTPDNNVLKDAG